MLGAAQVPETNPNLLRTKNWYFGEGLGISFQTDAITIDTQYNGLNYEGTAILNTSEGLLRYYSDGRFLYDKNHQIVNPSVRLRADNSSCQGVVLCESPSNSNLINILTTTPTYTNQRSGYRYSLYDESLDSFIFINKILIKDVGEKQNSINHQNNNSIWIMTHSLNDDFFYNFLLRANQLNCCPVINKIGENYTDRFPSQGILKFSQNGQLVCNANWNLLNFELYKFSNEEGLLSNLIEIPLFYPYGCEFTSDSKNLYITDRGHHIFKYHINLKNTNYIIASKDTQAFETDETFGQLQMSLVGNIYASRYQDSFLSAFLLDDKTEIYKKNAVDLKEEVSLGGLPNFNSSYFHTPSIDFAYTEDCWGHSYSFEGRDTFDADGYKWIFEKVNSSELSVISGKNCVFTFSDTGKWEVSHVAWNTSRADTVTKTLTIRPKWELDVLGRDTFYCRPFDSSRPNSGQDIFKLTLQAPEDMHCVHWNGEEPNLDESLGPIVDYDYFHTDTLVIDTAGTYIVKLTNKTFCQMWDTIVVREELSPQKSVISRAGNQLSSSITAAEYRWYYNGNLKLTTTNSQLVPDSNGYWQVQLVSEFGCESELSDSLLIDFASIKEVSEQLSEVSFKVYPNPSDGKISIERSHTGPSRSHTSTPLSMNDLYTITVSDLNGKVVYTTKQNLSLTFELDFEFTPGNYIITLTNENGETGSKQITVR